jgi:hypothetical protein
MEPFDSPTRRPPPRRARRALVRGTAPSIRALLDVEFPGLSPARRAAMEAFIAGRFASLPSPLALGVGIVGTALSAPCAAGAGFVARGLSRHSLPVSGEYVKLVRSLAVAYIWERWPGTAPDGSAAAAEQPA